MIQTLDLNGAWKIRWSDGERGRPAHALSDTPDEMRYIPAHVPGEIHLDLWKAGLIADPLCRHQCAGRTLGGGPLLELPPGVRRPG